MSGEQFNPEQHLTKRQGAIECVRRSKRGYQLTIAGILTSILIPIFYIAHLYIGMGGTIIATTYFAYNGWRLGGDMKSLQLKYEIDPRAR